MPTLLADTPSVVAGSYGIATSLGLKFQVSTTVTAHRIGWYRGNTTPAHKPLHIGFGSTPAGGGAVTTHLGLTTPPDNGAVGWQWLTLTTPVTLVSGRDYVLWGGWAVDQWWYYFGNSGRPAIPSPFNWLTGDTSAGNYSGSSSFPTSTNDALVVAFNIDTDDPTEAEPDPYLPPTNANIVAQLRDWLDVEEGTQGQSAPLLIHTILEGFVTSVGTQFDNLNAKLDHATNGLPAIKTQTVANGAALTALSTAVGILLDRLSSTLTEKLNDASDAIVDWLNNPPWATPGDVASGGGSSTFDPADWTIRETLTGTGASTWDEPADRYVFTITNPEVRSPGMTINGVPYFLTRGWWAPCEIDIVGRHATFVGIASHWYEVGKRLPGVIFYVDPDIEWTLQALDFTPGAGGTP